MIKLVIAISGKRKSGKDYCAQFFAQKLTNMGHKVEICAISYSLKQEFARLNGINFEQLLTDGPEKEKYRKEMIKWGEIEREKNPEVFCRSAIESTSNAEIVIISDCRRPTDFQFFKSNFKTITIRVEASLEARFARNYKFVEGIDDAPSECALDDANVDFVIQNCSETGLDEQFVPIVRVLEI